MRELTPVRRLYERHAANSRSWIRRAHRTVTRSPRLTKLLFGIEVEAVPGQPAFFDLTTVLMAGILRRRLRSDPDPKLLEIGVGSYATLSGCVARHGSGVIDAVDVHQDRVDSACAHVERNAARVRVFQSDVFSNVGAERYDVIFWNLPYRSDPARFLAMLMADAPDHLQERGSLLIGYNTQWFAGTTAREIVKAQSRLRLLGAENWWWNRHEVLDVGFAQASDGSEALSSSS